MVFSSLLMFIVPGVKAETLCNYVYEETTNAWQGAGGTDSPNHATGSFNAMIPGWQCPLGTWVMGGEGMAFAPEDLEKLPNAMRYGLLNYTYTYMYASFFQMPGADIPSTYANLLLPKELRPSSESLVYAAGGSPPDGRNATEYLGDIQINNLWGISFGISMLVYTIVLVYAGFIIIFRQKVGGQTVANVGMAIQGLVLSLIFSLASFALGGIFINLSKFLVIVLAGLLSSTLQYSDGAAFEPTYISSPLSIIGGNHASLFDFADIGNIFTRAGETATGSNACDSWDITCRLNNTFNPITIIGNQFEALIEAVGGAAIYILVRLIGAFVLFTAAFRIFFVIFSTYARMVLDIILAPIYFAVNAIPGNQSNYNSWLAKMFRNSLVLPFVFVIVNIGLYIMALDNVALSTTHDAVQSITGGATQGDASITDFVLTFAGPGYLVGMVFLLMAPSLVGVLDELLNTGKKQSAAVGKAGEAAQKALGSTPLVGGLFK